MEEGEGMAAWEGQPGKGEGHGKGSLIALLYI